jgi:hypothetical protein
MRSPAGLFLHFLILLRIFFILLSCKTFPPSAHAPWHQFVFHILLSLLLMLAYTFSSCHQFCWCRHTSSHPAINSAGAAIHIRILPSILLVLPYTCHPAISSAGAAIHILILP